MMQTIEITGYKRENLGKAAASRLRKQSHIPCVLYGGKAHIHFYIAMAELKQLIYTPEVYFITLHLQKVTYTCILQDLQVHPVSEMVLHLDFLQIFDKKPIRMQIPVVFTGTSPGVAQGGLLVKKLRKLKVVALPKNMPAHIHIDITSLTLGKTCKVEDIQADNCTILDDLLAPVAMVAIPRVLRSKASGEAEAT